MKAALLVTLIVGVSCADVPLLGAEKCTWGPAYWCSSIENARGCGSGSEEHCRTKVWVGDHPLANKITNPIPESKEKKVLDNVKANCALCELIGKKVLDSLTNNATEAEVVQELELVCEVLPASFKDTCTDFVDEYGRMFYEAFLQTADVHELCVFLGLCSEEFTRIMQSTEMLTALMGGGTFQDIPCDTCQSLTALVQKEVLANEADIEAMLDQVCPLLPVDQNECDETINQMFEAAVQFFESYSPLEVCQLVGLCEDAAANAVFGLEPVQFGQEGQTGVAAEDNMVF